MNDKRDFQATALGPDCTRKVTVVSYGGDMAVCDSSEGPVLITKEQAMKFFNLTSATEQNEMSDYYQAKITNRVLTETAWIMLGFYPASSPNFVKVDSWIEI